MTSITTSKFIEVLKTASVAHFESEWETPEGSYVTSNIIEPIWISESGAVVVGDHELVFKESEVEGETDCFDPSPVFAKGDGVFVYGKYNSEITLYTPVSH